MLLFPLLLLLDVAFSLLLLLAVMLTLLLLMFGSEAPIMEVIAAAKAAVKLGSAVIWGSNEVVEFGKFWRKGNWNWFEGFGGWVKSNVTVGNGADAEIVAMLEEQGSIVLARKFAFIRPSALDIDPESNIVAAADVVFDIAIAAGGKGWVWFPSYVVTSIVLSSAHLCTCAIIVNNFV